MSLVRAELLKMRKRAATYVVLGVLLVIMALAYLVIGLSSSDIGPAGGAVFRFPQAYSPIGQFVFGLGSLLAVAYAAAIVGADWNWGVLRNVYSRGESRSLYLLAKAAGLAVLFALAVLIAYAVGVLLVYFAAALAGQEVGNPLSGRSGRVLADSMLLGYPVLLERAAIGFAVAVVLKSQLAGVIVGIALYIGEGILATIMLVISLAGRFDGEEGFGFEPIGPEWYQYLPFSIGDGVLREVLPGGSVEGGFEDLILRAVPVEQAFVGVLLYMAAAMVIALLAVRREEIA